MMKRAIKSIVALVTCALVAVALAGCGNKGLATAYQKLLDEGLDGLYGHYLAYDESTDTLTLAIQYDEDFELLDKAFDILNKSTRGAQIGTLILEDGSDLANGEFYERISERIGKLSCGSIKCLSVGGVLEHMQTYDVESEEWTKVLTKTEALYDPQFSMLASYSDEGKANLAHVKGLWVPGDKEKCDLDGVGVLSGLEEVVLTAGLTQDAREQTQESGIELAYDNVWFSELGELEHLQRFLFYPELESWEPNEHYYATIMVLQSIVPEAKTNVPGSGWDGDEGALVELASMDPIADSGEAKYVSNALTHCLSLKATYCFETGQGFEASSDTPKISGKCYVYMAYPTEDEWNKEGVLYRHDGKVLLEELESKGVETPESPTDFGTFVYAYPLFDRVGTYTDGTEAYSTRTMVQVFDMENKVRYDPVQVELIQPSDSIYTDGVARSKGATVKWHEFMRERTICDYVSSLM